MSFSCIEYTSRAGIARITLARPEALNAISFGMLDELEQALDQIEADETVRLLVLTGRGRGFCAGADLKGFAQDGPAERTSASFVARIQAMMSRVRVLPIPVVAGLNGITMAGGLELALCADIIVAAESAKIGDCHVNFGVIPGAGGAAILPRIVGPVVGKYLLFTGEAPTARALEHTGLLAKVFSDETFEADLAALVARIAEKSPLGLKIIKRIIAEAALLPIDEGLKIEVEANAIYARSEDMREGLAAFAAKRQPAFVGR
ncbi:enoyl-CoA hydratase [Bradyrhizobium diazoefficiens]